jgi:hypothetical protein
MPRDGYRERQPSIAALTPLTAEALLRAIRGR